MGSHDLDTRNHILHGSGNDNYYYACMWANLISNVAFICIGDKLLAVMYVCMYICMYVFTMCIMVGSIYI